VSRAEIILTPDGQRRLRAELDRLRRMHEAAVERTRTALSHAGDLAANGEFLDAREEQTRLELRILALEERLSLGEVVEPDLTDGRLGVGERARLRDLDSGAILELRVVGAAEADPAASTVSYRSPVGAALLGARAGDQVRVDVPGGVLRVEVLEVDI
jgi:transcription elongation factor GreA